MNGQRVRPLAFGLRSSHQSVAEQKYLRVNPRRLAPVYNGVQFRDGTRQPELAARIRYQQLSDDPSEVRLIEDTGRRVAGRGTVKLKGHAIILLGNVDS